MSAFFVTDTGSKKRIHRFWCRYAKHPYRWADRFGGDEVALLADLMWTGAVMWHDGCRLCCPRLVGGIADAQEAHRRNGAEHALRGEVVLP